MEARGSTDAGLRRTLGLVALTVYGIGDILGAGIYALVGDVAASAQMLCWLAFAIAMFVASFTALSYSELVVRFPRSGGESVFTHRGFKSPSAGLLVGWLVFCSGVVSVSAIAHAFAGYVGGFWPIVPDWLVWVVFVLVLALINFWGIRESSAANLVCTFIEASGLLLVLAAGIAYLGRNAAAEAPSLFATAGAPGWTGVLQGAALSFFAFIGFQDMVNIAEEVKEPEKRFPIAIITALSVAGVVYIAICYVATAVVPPDVLGESDAPLLTVVQAATTAVPPWLFNAIALFALANTALLNFITSSRLIYGMADQDLLPHLFHGVHPRRRTPHRAILAVLLVALILVFSGTLRPLAGATSSLLLITFSAVNLALIMLKLRDKETRPRFRVPIFVPVCGIITSLGLLAFQQRLSLLITSLLILLGAGLVAGRLLRREGRLGR